MISVLYVDDEPDLLDLVQLHLEKTGEFRVDLCESADDALNILKETGYDAVVSDFQMPGMDGIEFLKNVRDMNPRLPFIIFTGRGREKVVIDALNSGADYYLQKGIEMLPVFAELQNMIRRAVERKRLQDALMESETRYREFFTTSRDAVYICSPDGKWIDFNDAILELLGYESREEFLQVPVPAVYASEGDRSPFQDLVIRMGFVKEFPLQGRKRDGTIIDALVTAVPIKNPDGSVNAFTGTIRDVTEKKRSERVLEESEAKFRSFFEHSLDAVFLATTDGRILAANPAACRLLGYTEEEIRKGGRDLIVDRTDPRFLIGLEDRRKAWKGRGEMNFVHKNGTKIPCELSSGAFTDRAGSRMISIIVHDITMRRNREAALRESEERYRTLAETAPVGILTCDRDGQITYLNRKMLELLGSPGKEKTREINLLRFPPLVEVGFAEGLRKTLETGLPVQTKEAEYTSKWGKTARFRLHISPLLNNGSVEGAQVILDDITPGPQAAESCRTKETGAD